ncbi:hypothetical protein [Campylobacter troglodytis]|uniref:hypothetical protein n=1 Tax=Campylobacter troglodytis TaxID=654363 RepID=UPI00115B58A9|nr:hypothetical protein [Campylobacter troglodytis]TQR58174.1 hypothetical protein DMC01_07990 [Campylobacter troglodytis]
MNIGKTLISVQASFFQNKDQAAFKAPKVEYAYRRADDFELSKTREHTSNIIKLFDDEKQISLRLSSESLNFLKDHFDSSNFITLKDGSVGLSGDAAVFVEGWYKDLAYNRGFLANDFNGNSTIKALEHLGFKNSLAQEADSIKNGPWLKFFDGTNFAYENGKITNKAISLDELINISILSDKDRNGEISFLEAYASTDALEQGYENWLNDFLRSYFKDENINIQTYSLIAKKFNNEKAMAVGLYETIFETSLYGGLNSLAAHRFEELNKEFELELEDNQNTQKIKKKKTKKAGHEEALLAKYPEFKALIEAKETISEAELDQLREKKKIINSYQHLTQEKDLSQEFTQAVFKTDLTV